MKKCLIESDSDSDSYSDNENNNIINKKKIYEISEFNYIIRNLVENEIDEIEIVGEITNLNKRNHLYFSLKDNNSKIDCFLFESIYKQNRIELKNGDKIVCKGKFSLYQRFGKLQLTIDSYYIYGQGELHLKFIEQKELLQSLGYFKDKNKIKNVYNTNIGIVTSIDSSAYQDVLSVIQKKNSTVNLFVSNCRVQGIQCEKDICTSIKKLDKLSMDVIIVTRGGGSLEDLWGFNEKELIETIHNCKTVIISAVGHQTDYTLTDYVADVTAITPSIGADIAVTSITEIQTKIQQDIVNIQNKTNYIIDNFKLVLEKKLNRLKSLYPIQKIILKHQQIISFYDKIHIKCINEIRKINKN